MLDGSYAFTVSAQLVFAQESFNNSLVANLVWHLFNRDALSLLENLGLIGFDRLGLEAQRDTIFNLLEAAADIPVIDETAPDATEVVTEATEAPTEVPTAAPTELPTDVPTSEATEPTEVPTEAPTAVPTEATDE